MARNKVKKYNIYTLSSLSGALWLFLCINPFILWIMPQSPWYILAFGLVFLSTIQFIKSEDLYIDHFRLLLVLLLFLFSSYLLLVDFTPERIFQFSPFLMLAFWNPRATYGVYCYFRFIILFFSIFAIINSAFSFIGITTPYIALPPRSAAHILSDTTLRLHLFTVTNYNLTAETNETLIRACGPLQEGGHFGIILGIIILIDNFISQKINKIILTTGILTFSPAFLILLISTLLYNFYTSENKLRKLTFVTIGFFVVLGIFFALPEKTKDKVAYSFYERNFETVLQTAGEQKSLNSALSERTTLEGEYLYSQFQKADITTRMFGFGAIGNEIILSDYRCTIARLGYVGYLLLLILGTVCIFSKWKRPMIMMAIPFLLVLVHRSWMLDSTYIHYLCFCGISVFAYFKTKHNYYESWRVR